jgi:YD repeat-containing protein
MTDGLGGVSYTYDSLSRLRSESRGITGVGSYQISYDYNLANQLTSITDPYNVTINYTRDTTGRISEISNTSTTYASGIQYRAWGDLKHLNYGNGQALDASYNARMFTSAFTVTGMTSAMMSKTYDYYSDGHLRFSSDLIDHRFDRSYGFDHAGRLTQALSGAEARDEAATNDRPYNETLSYDSFNHPTYRNVNTWSDGGVSTTDGYTNNRHASLAGTWQYDADGRMTREPEGPYTYDAAGRNTRIEMTYSTVDTRYDGDGRQIRTEEHTINGGFYADTTYHIRSTVLEGQVLSEFSSNGSSHTYVYAGMALLARHLRVSGSDQIWWERRDPSGASVKHGFAEQELEPFGADAGRSEQTVIPDEGALAPLGSSFNAANPTMTYTIDGLRTTLDNFMARMGRVASDPFALMEVATQPVGYRGRGYVSGRPFEVTVDINRNVTGVYFGQGDLGDELSFLHTELTSVTPIYGSSWSLLASGLAAPQNPYKGTPLSPSEINQLRTDATNLLKDEACAKFMSAILNQLTGNTGKKAYSTDAMDIFKAVEKQGGFGRRSGSMSAEGGSTVGNKDAYININFFISDNVFISASNGRIILHELLHVGSSTSADYSHYEMAQAAYDVALAQGYKDIGQRPSGGDPGGVDQKNSDVFGSFLFKACRVR